MLDHDDKTPNSAAGSSLAFIKRHSEQGLAALADVGAQSECNRFKTQSFHGKSRPSHRTSAGYQWLTNQRDEPVRRIM
jgi:hypothetical protein